MLGHKGRSMEISEEAISIVHIEMVVAWTRAGVQNIPRSGQMNLHLGRREEGKFNK